ncbi:hypothetical protein [Methanimicrococcus blatticola]|uniref:hypothetical protein n=1 Tax=Methanimicrococcus blatticola TaxID=91560 RepID=UPI00105FD7AD|nr:hypothetical protein [Methanimicrococcus blatticola]MBZ3934905.1 hypothetical protein [Methanimicrococcus blatticola]MCC2508996.1 hypothetical protein [Methanimicrococcus blatticola]
MHLLLITPVRLRERSRCDLTATLPLSYCYLAVSVRCHRRRARIASFIQNYFKTETGFQKNEKNITNPLFH